MLMKRSPNFGFWHNVRAQIGAFEGTKTASLPTFVRECRQTADIQTYIRGALKVGT
jgi:hypothetical protein